MWLLEFLFFLTTLFIGWTMFGYFLFITFLGLLQKRTAPKFPERWPLISLIVPSLNENEQIIEKVNNIRALDYPLERLEVIFADGGSTDGTADLLESEIKPGEPYRLVRCRGRGKIQQINEILPQLKGELIVNTDVDARLDSDALRWTAAEFAAAPEVWVLGAYSFPASSLDLEHYYWDAQNKSRFMESDGKTSSIVIAQCYGFRRELLSIFPDDVVADDIYVAFLANTLGYRSVYSRKVKARETREPQSYAQFLPHKFRKSNAFLRESLRFFYRLPEMEPLWKTMYLTRVAQQLFLPWAMLLWIVLAGSMVTLYRIDLAIFTILFLSMLLLLTNRVFVSVKLPDEPHDYSLMTMAKGFLITTMLMLLTGLTYPFFRQSSSYVRLESEQTASGNPEIV